MLLSTPYDRCIKTYSYILAKGCPINKFSFSLSLAESLSLTKRLLSIS